MRTIVQIFVAFSEKFNFTKHFCNFAINYPAFEGALFIFQWAKVIQVRVSVHCMVRNKKLIKVRKRSILKVYFFGPN